MNNAITLATFEDGSRALLTVHQAFLHTHLLQFEAFLQPYQAHHHNMVVNDIASFHNNNYGTMGQQNLVVSDPTDTLPLFWDEWKLFFAISPPSPDDMNSDLPHYELTSPSEYLPQSS